VKPAAGCLFKLPMGNFKPGGKPAVSRRWREEKSLRFVVRDNENRIAKWRARLESNQRPTA
jgi:hypothetical protein